jgi:hypothetical protein
MRTPRWAVVAVLAIGALTTLRSVFSPPHVVDLAHDAGRVAIPPPHGYDAPHHRWWPTPSVDYTPHPSLLLAVNDRIAALVPGPDGGSLLLAPVTLAPALSADWAKGKFDHFSADELAQLAERCELRWRLPPFSSTDRPSFADAAEEQAYAAVLAAEQARYQSALHALHAELTGGPGPTDLRSLRDSLRANPDDEPLGVHRALSAALAGEGPAPTGIYARYLSEELSAGDHFETALAAALGPERARALRDASGPRHTLTGCTANEGVYRSER